METINLVLKTLRLAQLEVVEDRQVVGVDRNSLCPSEGGDRLPLFLIFHLQLLEFSLHVCALLPLPFIGIVLCRILRILVFLRSMSGFRYLTRGHRLV